MTDTIGERIRNLRLIRGYTQEELAERLYMRKSTISAYENNVIDIKVSVLMECKEGHFLERKIRRVALF